MAEAEKRLDRRTFLKYAGLGSLATLSLMAGGTKVAKAQLDSVLRFLSKIPVDILERLPGAISEINADQAKYMELFMTKPRSLLKDEFGIHLAFDEFQVIAFDLSPEETVWPKVVADPAYPYEAEIKIGPVALGFAEGRVGLVLRERS
ncbi:TPA: hypothetical protein EYP12_03220 [Candidatus Bipolaricaulota bacterium]|nr:hypothetical protein [Candidatus Bipolaricaulota bacterium]